jgi:hypothetical protein
MNYSAKGGVTQKANVKVAQEEADLLELKAETLFVRAVSSAGRAVDF